MKITQPPAPFHAIARGFAGPSLLAMVLVDKYADHQPLNRQSDQFAREGITLSVSTMADHVGASTAVLMPLYELIKAHVFRAERIHGDDTTVPVLAKVKGPHRAAVDCFCAGFSDAWMTDRSRRGDGRRPRSAKARNR